MSRVGGASSRSTGRALLLGLALATVGLVVSAGAAMAAESSAVPAPTPGASVSPIAPDEATVTGQELVQDGHVDLGPRFVDDQWRIQLRDDRERPAVWRELSDVVLAVPDVTSVAVPEDEQFAFLGEPGEPVWLLPQVQQAGVVWPGWNTQDPQVATTVDRELMWTLHGMQGPGDFALFLNAEFGEPQVVFDSDAPMPQDSGVSTNTHVHGNWVFTQPGTYLLDIEMSAATTDGDTVSDRDTLRLLVGDGQDPAQAFAAVGSRTTVEEPADGASTAATGGQDDDAAGTSSQSPTQLVLLGVIIGLLVMALVAALLLRRRRQAPTSGGTA